MKITINNIEYTINNSKEAFDVCMEVSQDTKEVRDLITDNEHLYYYCAIIEDVEDVSSRITEKYWKDMYQEWKDQYAAWSADKGKYLSVDEEDAKNEESSWDDWDEEFSWLDDWDNEEYGIK